MGYPPFLIWNFEMTNDIVTKMTITKNAAAPDWTCTLLIVGILVTSRMDEKVRMAYAIAMICVSTPSWFEWPPIKYVAPPLPSLAT